MNSAAQQVFRTTARGPPTLKAALPSLKAALPSPRAFLPPLPLSSRPHAHDCDTHTVARLGHQG